MKLSRIATSAALSVFAIAAQAQESTEQISYDENDAATYGCVEARYSTGAAQTYWHDVTCGQSAEAAKALSALPKVAEDFTLPEIGTAFRNCIEASLPKAQAGDDSLERIFRIEPTMVFRGNMSVPFGDFKSLVRAAAFECKP